MFSKALNMSKLYEIGTVEKVLIIAKRTRLVAHSNRIQADAKLCGFIKIYKIDELY